ncbi:hypothetical protein BHYA_0096g00090 [Botrytis hyacinthi]|uniref:RecA family profile 1 domain-containing protein n=1 Tax=Botrytis hyacinthi TaxID=278943 RepID=A0A4Z1GQE8_9HELO|nr:hypothetical protein BHYA_0096g00090 [Botrytis hyacinthi]
MALEDQISRRLPHADTFEDRMPTVSAAQALQDLESSPTHCIPTGLANLDLGLQSKDPLQASTSADQNHGGIPRGKVTEIYGPPGVGKTTLG